MCSDTRSFEQLAEAIDAHVAALPPSHRFKHLPNAIEESRFWSYAVSIPHVPKWVKHLRNKKRRPLLSCWSASHHSAAWGRELLAIVVTQRCRKEVYQIWQVLRRPILQDTQHSATNILLQSIEKLCIDNSMLDREKFAIWIVELESTSFSPRAYEIVDGLSLEELEAFHPNLEKLRQRIDSLRQRIVRGPSFIPFHSNIKSIPDFRGKGLDSEGKALLKEALTHLDERTCRLLMLRFVDGRKQKDIADKAGLSESSVSEIIACGIADLRRWMLDNGYDSGS